MKRPRMSIAPAGENAMTTFTGRVGIVLRLRRRAEPERDGGCDDQQRRERFQPRASSPFT